MKATHTTFDRIGMVARWRPVHLGHQAVLHNLCDQAEHALIGIGSAYRYNTRNPFTLDETRDMLRLVLQGRDNYSLIPVPDLDDGPRWRLMILEMFGPLDAFVTANPYVASLLKADYRLLKPVALVPAEQRVAIEGAMVRRAMARGEPWEHLVPSDVAAYLQSNHLVERFRQEFGLQTLALDSMME